WCREIGEMMGVDLPVVPILHQYVVTDRIQAFAELGRELPMIRDPDESWYLRQEGSGVIVGPYEHDGIPWSIDGVPSDFGMELLPPDLDRIQDIVAMAMERVPAAADGGLKRIVNGPITFTPDANPLIGPAFDVPNAYLLTGSSMGVMEGGGAGKFLAEWIVAGEPPMDPIAIDARRFGGYTDREYRVDKAVECFAAQFAIHHPYEERPAGRPKRVTPVFEAMRDRGAVFGSVYGWERPNWFARAGEVAETVLSFQRSNWFDAVARECANVRDSVALADLSVFSKFEVSGSDAARFMEGFGANRMPRNTGGIALNHCLTSSGGVLSEFTVTHLGENRFYLVSAAAAERHDQDLLKHRSQGLDNIRIENLTTRYGVLGLMGPRSRDVLAQLTDGELDNDSFPWLSAREIVVAGVSVRALRVSYVGELGWELHHPVDQQLQLFNALMGAGKKFEIGTFGAFAMNAMRLEKGYRAWGTDLTTERTPLEAGMKFFVKTNGRDFVGRGSMLRRAAEPGHWQMHLLQLDEIESDPFYAHTVFVADHPIGIVTSGAYGHRVRNPLALAYFRETPVVDTGLSVSILDQRVAARVLNQSPYDPANSRLRG
ncbi:MAG: FAD-dependent oxidoreductase, partial [Acidiferrobacterales bacterium]